MPAVTQKHLPLQEVRKWQLLGTQTRASGHEASQIVNGQVFGGQASDEFRRLRHGVENEVPICGIEANEHSLLCVGPSHTVAVGLTPELDRALSRDLALPCKRAEVNIHLVQIKKGKFMIATIEADGAEGLGMGCEWGLPLTAMCPRSKVVVEFVQGLIEECLTLRHWRKA